MKKQLFLVAITFAFLALVVGRANAQTAVDFTVNILTGSQSGNVFTGTFTYDSSDQITSFSFTDPAWDSNSFVGWQSNSPDWNFTEKGGAYYNIQSPAPNLSVWFNPNLGLLDDSFGFETANFWGTGDPQYQFCYGQSIDASSFLNDGYGTVTFSRLTVPEGGSALLYLLLAAAFCGGAMYFASQRNSFTAHAA